MRKWLLLVLAAMAVTLMTLGFRAVNEGRAATPIPALARGINITGWFRFPTSRDPRALAAYLSDPALTDIRAAGFDFVRLAVDPDIALTDPNTLLNAIRRIQRHGLTVVVSPHPHDWHLETSAADRDRLLVFWRALSPGLRTLDPARTVAEILNEPVFPGHPAAWAILQREALATIRRVMPDVPVILTGQDWGSIDGLLASTPESDPNVLYSFHFYEPSELTSLAAYRPGLDRAALGRLPFPASDRARCDATAGTSGDAATSDLMHYYCGVGWDVARLAARIDAASVWGRTHHVRLLAGEFGASAALNSVSRLGWLHSVRELLERDGIGWAIWGYDDVMGFDIARPPGLRPVLNQPVLAALGLLTGM